MGSTKNSQKQKRENNKQVALKRKEEQSQKKRIERIRKSEKEEIEKMAQQRRDGVRIDIWTHLMRGCIMGLCTLI